MPSQIVQVQLGNANKTYAFVWHGTPDDPNPLDIGDRVLLPSNVVTPEAHWGVVAAFGANGYTGAMTKILARGKPIESVGLEPPF